MLQSCYKVKSKEWECKWEVGVGEGASGGDFEWVRSAMVEKFNRPKVKNKGLEKIEKVDL